MYQRGLRRLAVAGVTLIAASSTACGAGGSDVAVESPDLAYEAIANMRENSTLSVLEPRNLLDALPNRAIVVKTDQGEDAEGRFSDLVVAGQITSVTPHEGIYYPNADPTATGDEEAGVMVVAFGDPRAAERVALVELRVDWSAGEKVVGETLQFRMAVPGGIDPTQFLGGVRGIDNAVVLLDRDDAGRNEGAYRPILNSAGLGSVHDDGTVSFAGFGDAEREFSAGIGTLDELKAEASKPEMSVEYAHSSSDRG